MRQPRGAERWLKVEIDRLSDVVGDPRRRTAVLLLASVLALGSADMGAVGAVAPQIEKAFHAGNLEVGLMVTVSALATASAMLPAGVMTDRWCRTHLLGLSVVGWGLAEIASAVAVSFVMLLLIRIWLGAMTATTGPTVASLTGDLFPAGQRSQIYGFIITGELLGAGLGLLVAGLVSSVAGWRVAFLVLALPSLALAWSIHRFLPEPRRGGQARLEVGARESALAASTEHTAGAGNGSPQSLRGSEAQTGSPVVELVEQRHVQPNEHAKLDRDVKDLTWWEATRYTLRVRSNLILILASGFGYFFLGGLETFALIYLKGHFSMSQAKATLIVIAVGVAAVAGAVMGGRVSDSLVRRGRIDGRLVVAAFGFTACALLLAPALISRTLLVSLPLFLLAGFAVSAPNPGMDAARLDVMPGWMWGRAESVRSLLRSLLQALAPLLFGLTSQLFGAASQGLGAGTGHSGSSIGLEPTFLIMLGPLLVAGAIVWWGKRFYPSDVAAAALADEPDAPPWQGAVPK